MLIASIIIAAIIFAMDQWSIP
ncbi:hypothetical protein [Duncaniella dubosii]